MSRFHYSIIFTMVLSIVLLNVLDARYKDSLPKIQLPEAAHHIVGQVPIIEHYDDGNLGGQAGYAPTIRNWGSIQVFSGATVSCDMSYVSLPIRHVRHENMSVSGDAVSVWPSNRRRRDEE